MRKTGEREQLIGTTYTDYTLFTPEGKECNLSDYVGKNKYTILEFWASWCGPCIEEVPHLKELYEQYNTKGLGIISISLDESKDNWINAIEKHEIPGINLSNLKGYQSEIINSYKIQGIPGTFIVDQEGKIVEINVRPSLIKLLIERNLLKF